MHTDLKVKWEDMVLRNDYDQVSGLKSRLKKNWDLGSVETQW